ncbi:HupE/UreJ family protein [Chitinimonas sp.]|uniref:HupE/UreJ family protein n=1 Tax=Chitinimonas sp. TaxID=1934313 RepID=UPI002F95BA11
MKNTTRLLIAGLAATAALPALAHSGVDHVHGFVAGFTHPLFGWDHLLAMFSVGVWSAQQGGRHVWALPLSFVATMAVGGALGMAGFSMGFTEAAIAVSVIAFGLLIAQARSLPTWLSALACSLAALAHGIAHGGELPQDGNPWGYAGGFLLATALLHCTGILFGKMGAGHGRWQRGFGLLASLAGGYLLLA